MRTHGARRVPTAFLPVFVLVTALPDASASPLFAGDEQHQLVRSVQLTLQTELDVPWLAVTFRLANGDEVKAPYVGDKVATLLKIFDLGLRPDAALFVDLREKQVRNVTVESRKR